MKNPYKEFSKLYGDRPQMIKTMEECGELIQAVCKYLISVDPELVANDYDPEACKLELITEAVQVEIMIKQLRYIFNDFGLWDRIEMAEVQRLKERLRHDGIDI